MVLLDPNDGSPCTLIRQLPSMSSSRGPFPGRLLLSPVKLSAILSIRRATRASSLPCLPLFPSLWCCMISAVSASRYDVFASLLQRALSPFSQYLAVCTSTFWLIVLNFVEFGALAISRCRHEHVYTARALCYWAPIGRDTLYGRKHSL